MDMSFEFKWLPQQTAETVHTVVDVAVLTLFGGFCGFFLRSWILSRGLDGCCCCASEAPPTAVGEMALGAQQQDDPESSAPKRTRSFRSVARAVNGMVVGAAVGTAAGVEHVLSS